ncbi:uncharacterized protein LOC131954687 [Physella acuta]|uniref:uncharacterized protein LOC131954687 n=1 Tax=Physella acuta TaxID=109671 RepID=UPI0027DE15D1|nr:uncharacterized protein LOC131954687 [Physella acuta]
MEVKINDRTFHGECYFYRSEYFYFNSTCSYTISRHYIFQGNNDFTIVLYPNISGNHSAKRYEQEIHFKNEKPIISTKTCNKQTSDGVNLLLCEYQRHDQSNVTTVIESNVKVLYQNKTHVKLEMSQNIKDIKIWARNIFGVESDIEKPPITTNDEYTSSTSQKQNEEPMDRVKIIILCCALTAVAARGRVSTPVSKPPNYFVYMHVFVFHCLYRKRGQTKSDEEVQDTLLPKKDKINAVQESSFEEINNQPETASKPETTSEVGNSKLVSNVNISVTDDQELGSRGLTTSKLHTYVTGCKKNPGHKGFIPLKDFNASCLPSRYHDDELMSETIKTLAALTVQVKTKFTSLERPEFCPGTQVPYPGYNDRGRHVMRVGTGRVYRVDKYTDSIRTCRCAKCQVSATPSKVWGEVKVLTATQVVFDASEARQASCVLGFDDNKSRVVSLDGWKVLDRADIEGDTCVLNYETCDLELVNELDKLCRLFDDLCREVEDKYRRFVDVDKLTVIVSHPHGCPKQVSLGQWTHKHKRDGEYTRYWYTTCTCPGSAGAYVYRVGCNPRISGLVHSGSNSEGNYSGESFDF